MSRKVEFSLEALKEYYLANPESSLMQTADHFGCGCTTIRRRLSELGIRSHGPRRTRKHKCPELDNREWLENEYLVEKKSIKQIAEEIGSTVGAVHSRLTHIGIKTRSGKEALAEKYPEKRTGEQAANWRGGSRFHYGSTGVKYKQVYAPDHPNATQAGYVMEHRLIMEEKLGRYLTSDEIIHHIDGDGLNNDINNLEVHTRSGHLKLHAEKRKENKKRKKLARLKAEVKKLEGEL